MGKIIFIVVVVFIQLLSFLFFFEHDLKVIHLCWLAFYCDKLINKVKEATHNLLVRVLY